MFFFKIKTVFQSVSMAATGFLSRLPGNGSIFMETNRLGMGSHCFSAFQWGRWGGGGGLKFFPSLQTSYGGLFFRSNFTGLPSGWRRGNSDDFSAGEF